MPPIPRTATRGLGLSLRTNRKTCEEDSFPLMSTVWTSLQEKSAGRSSRFADSARERSLVPRLSNTRSARDERNASGCVALVPFLAPSCGILTVLNASF
jgi:hypothetical protein